MGSKMLHQAAKFIRDRRNNRRWLAFVLCLAVAVTIGTFGVLAQQGKALENEETVEEETTTAASDTGEPEEEAALADEEAGPDADDGTAVENADPTDADTVIADGSGAASENTVLSDDLVKAETGTEADAGTDDGGILPEEDALEPAQPEMLAQPEDVSENDPEVVEEEEEPVVLDVSGNDTEDFDHTDLKNFTTGVTIKNKEGEIVVRVDENGKQEPEDAKLYIGETYQVSLSFEEDEDPNSNKQFQVNGNQDMTYQIPGNFKCKKVDNYSLRDSENTQIGNYSIDENGLLTVHFNDPRYVDQFRDTYLNINFDATVQSSGTVEQEEIDFGDDIKIDVLIKSDADIEVHKAAGNYDPSTRTFSYEVTAKVRKGVVNSFSLEDEGTLSAIDGSNVQNDKFALVTDSVSVKGPDGKDLALILLDPQGNPIRDKDGNEITWNDLLEAEDHQITAEDDKVIKLDDFKNLENVSVEGPFSAGDEIQITYKMKVDDSFYTENNVSGKVDNTITVTGKTDGGPVTGEDQVSKTFHDTALRKNGKTVTINGEEVVEWTVIVGDGYRDLKGAWVKDTLNGTSMSYYTGKPVTVYPLNSNAEPCETKVEHEWETTGTFIFPYEENTKSFAVQLPKTVPDGCVGFGIVYYTEYNEKPNYNDNKVEILGSNIRTDGQGMPGIIKEVTGANDSYISFKVSIDVPAGLDENTFYLEDALGCIGKYYVENIPENLKVTVQPEGENERELPEGWGDGHYKRVDRKNNPFPSAGFWSNGVYYTFNIGFNMTEGNVDSSHWNISKSSKLTITYQIPTSAKTWDMENNETGKTLKQLLDEGEQLWNNATLVYNSKGDKVSDGDGYRKSGDLDKLGQIQEDGSIRYTVTFDNTNDIDIHTCVLSDDISKFFFIDKFDECLEYEAGSLQATVYSRWDVIGKVENPTVWAIYDYKGDITGNEISAAANDFQYKDGSTQLADVSESAMKSAYGTLGKVIEDKNQYQNVAIVFTYTLKVNNKKLQQKVNELKEKGEGATTIDLGNTAWLNWETPGGDGKNEVTIGPAKETVTYKTGIIEKTSEIDDHDTVEFKIELNNSASDLSPTDTYDVTDKMSSNLLLYWDTIEVEYEKVEKVGDQEISEWISFDTEGSEYTYKKGYKEEEDGSPVLTFTLPDELHIRISYETKIKGNNEKESVQNTATLHGYVDYTDKIDTEYDVDHTDASVGGTNVKFTLLKQDSDTKQLMPGVPFDLYTEAKNDPGVDENKTIKYGNKELYYRGSYLTGNDGAVTITGLSKKVLYALVETETPAGYQKMEEPRYFYVETAGSEGDIKPVPDGTIYIIENTPTYFLLPETGSTGLMRYTLGGIVLFVFGMALTLLYKTNVHRRRKEGP